MTVIIDWFEGGLRMLAYAGFVLGAVSLLSFAKTDERHAGAKFIAFGLLFYVAWGLLNTFVGVAMHFAGGAIGFDVVQIVYGLLEILGGLVGLAIAGLVGLGGMKLKSAVTT